MERLKNIYDFAYSSRRLIDCNAKTLTETLLKAQSNWGHDHDFGDGTKLDGHYHNRHLITISGFVDLGLPYNLANKHILDIGPNTGGSSLLLTAMGANVTAVEIDPRSCLAMNVLKRAYNISTLSVINDDFQEYLHSCNKKFDYVIFAGVIYLVENPLFALKKIYNSLYNNGEIYLQSHTFESEDACAIYGGSSIAEGNRTIAGSNYHYFIPSESCLKYWIADSGFHDVKVSHLYGESSVATGRAVRGGISK